MNLVNFFAGLAERHIRYVLVGGFALQLHGFQRATYDIDLALALDETNLNRFVEFAQHLGLKPVMPVPLVSLNNPSLLEQWHREKGMLAFALRSEQADATVVDLLIQPEVPFADLIQRATQVQVLGNTLPIASLEDLITMKRAANRPKDQIDLLALEKLQRGENPNE